MTVDIFEKAASYTVQGVGPYQIPHPYAEGAIVARVVIEGVAVPLDLDQFSVVPEMSITSGNLFLPTEIAALHAGRKLWIDRDTVSVQIWEARYGDREVGIEKQLDRDTMGLQEVRDGLAGALRLRGPVPPADIGPGETIMLSVDGKTFVAGPNAADIAGAQGYAAQAAAALLATQEAALYEFKNSAALVAWLTANGAQGDGTIYTTRAEGWSYTEDASSTLPVFGGVGLQVNVDANGRKNARAFGAAHWSMKANSGPELQAALDSGGSIVIDDKFWSDQPLAIGNAQATEVIFINFQNAYIAPGDGFPAGETLLSVVDCGRRSGGATTEQPYLTELESRAAIRGMLLSGRKRTIKCHGLELVGQNDDLIIERSAIHDFKGSGFLGCDYRSATPNEWRESAVTWLHIKNCGDITEGADYAACEFGISGAVGGPVGAINNINMTGIKVIYPRGVGMRWRNEGVGSVKSIRRFNINGLFVHGQQSISGNDPNGEPWKSARPLIEIGHAGATGTQTCAVTINNASIVEVETGQRSAIVRDGSQLFIDDVYIAASDGRTGFLFDGAENSAIRGVRMEDPQVESSNTFSSLIEVISMSPQAFVTVDGVFAGYAVTAEPMYIGDLKYLRDLGRRTATITKVADLTAGAATAVKYFGGLAASVEYVHSIKLIPYGDLLANDVDYATITIARKEPGVATGNIAVATTKATGGTGSWTSGLTVEIPITAQTRLEPGQELALSITKTGGGVIVPECHVEVVLSSNLSVN